VPLLHSSREAVILDSNLLLLLVVGSWNPRAIETHKRLSGLTFQDFLLLSTYVGSYRRILTTAHILTEVSNLAGTASGATKASIFAQLARIIETMDEHTLPAALVAAQPEFIPFGITDAAISLVSTSTALVTLDGKLARHLQLRGHPAMTLDQLRLLRDAANNR
jgi:hypothetical protein